MNLHTELENPKAACRIANAGKALKSAHRVPHNASSDTPGSCDTFGPVLAHRAQLQEYKRGNPSVAPGARDIQRWRCEPGPASRLTVAIGQRCHFLPDSCPPPRKSKTRRDRKKSNSRPSMRERSTSQHAWGKAHRSTASAYHKDDSRHSGTQQHCWTINMVLPMVESKASGLSKWQRAGSLAAGAQPSQDFICEAH